MNAHIARQVEATIKGQFLQNLQLCRITIGVFSPTMRPPSFRFLTCESQPLKGKSTARTYSLSPTNEKIP